MNNKIDLPKGTKDIYYPEIIKWQFLEDHIRQFFSQFLYQEIRTPIFEHSELFRRGIGSETEVVQKEMYTFKDRAGRNLTLRPENTASVARAAIDNNFFTGVFPLRFYYIGPMFRYEKPQKGRHRQFHQFGIEVFGDDSAGVDAEVIYAAFRFLERIHIKDIKLQINSVGCEKCRPGFLKKLATEAEQKQSQLCVDCQRKVYSNPLRIFDCKKESCRKISDTFPKVTDYLCDSCSSHFEQLKETLSLFNIDFKVDSRMVRGLDYYTKTTFEITSGQLGAQDAILGGGRYNNLIKDLGGPDISGMGFAAGMERIILHIEDLPDTLKKKILVAYQNKRFEPQAIELVRALWEKGFTAYVNYDSKNMKKQFKKGDRLKAAYTFIMGDDEIQNNTISIKNMSTKEQISIKSGELDQWLKINI